MRKLLRKSNKGFTLIELMIVVAIIGILAAIAIPNFLRFQLKSKTSEGKVNIAAIRTGEEAFLAEFGRYVASTPVPLEASVNSQKLAWPTNGQGFDTLGWGPEGQVFFSYSVGTDANGGYMVSAVSDLDNDTTDQAWGYSRPGSAGDVATGHTATCGSLKSAQQVGPCDGGAAAPKFGQSVF
jgi:type IV pilus assembly protein PilA